MTRRGEVRARWRLESATSSASALTVYSLVGDVDGALVALGLPALSAGEKGLRRIEGVDDVLVARMTEHSAWMVTHAGRGVGDAMRRRLDLADLIEAERPAGPNLPDPSELLQRFPEARDTTEARMLWALPRARGLIAAKRLLGEPDRWRASGLEPDEPLVAARTELFAPPVLARLLNPPIVALLGPPNIGKSTLVNTMARRAVSVVAPTPGTTRDHVGVEVDFAGLVARVIDTPGVRDVPAGEHRDVEERAIELARSVVAGADLVLECFDPTTGPVPRAAGTGSGGHSGVTMTVCLRADMGEPGHACDARVSAHTGAGLGELYAMVSERLVPRSALADPRPWRFWEA